MRKVDIAVGGVAVAFGAFWIWQSARFEFVDGVPGPGFLPMVLAVVITFLGALLVASRVLGDERKTGSFTAPSASALFRVGAVGGLIVLAAVVMPAMGFVPTFVALIVALLFGVEGMRSWTAAVTALVVPLAAYWLFGVLFGVRLPQGPLGI